MRYELWEEDHVYQRGNWSVFPVDENYQKQLDIHGPGFKYRTSFDAESLDEAIALANKYLGLPPSRSPFDMGTGHEEAEQDRDSPGAGG